MKLLRTSLVTLAVAALLAACGTTGGTPSAPPNSSQTSTSTSAPTTTTKPPAIADHGIVVAFCTAADQPMSVVSFTLDHSMTTGHNFAGTYTTPSYPTGLCSILGGANFDDGQELRSLFNNNFTAILTTHNTKDTASSPTNVGWHGSLGEADFTPVSPFPKNDFTGQADSNPMFHPKDGRVYYWNLSDKNSPVLMSCNAMASDCKTETALTQLYPYVTPFGNVHGAMYMPNVQAPVVLDQYDRRVLNPSGTRAATLSGTELQLLQPDKQPNGQGTTVPGQFKGDLRVSSFPNDSTLVLRDDHQIYRADLDTNGNVIKLTTLLHNTNDSLVVWDPTVSPDGNTAAFLANDGQGATLYTVAMDGSNADSPEKFIQLKTPLTANILEYR